MDALSAIEMMVPLMQPWQMDAGCVGKSHNSRICLMAFWGFLMAFLGVESGFLRFSNGVNSEAEIFLQLATVS
jgi:hypothetical protein